MPTSTVAEHCADFGTQYQVFTIYYEERVCNIDWTGS